MAAIFTKAELSTLEASSSVGLREWADWNIAQARALRNLGRLADATIFARRARHLSSWAARGGA